MWVLGETSQFMAILWVFLQKIFSIVSTNKTPREFSLRNNISFYEESPWDWEKWSSFRCLAEQSQRPPLELEERVEIAFLIGAVVLRSHISLVFKVGLRKVKPMPCMWAWNRFFKLNIKEESRKVLTTLLRKSLLSQNMRITIFCDLKL